MSSHSKDPPASDPSLFDMDFSRFEHREGHRKGGPLQTDRDAPEKKGQRPGRRRGRGDEGRAGSVLSREEGFGTDREQRGVRALGGWLAYVPN